MPERLAPIRARREVRPAAVKGPLHPPQTPPGRRHPEPGPDRSERFTLIEFVWEHASGAQPVLLLSRELLH